MRGLWPGGCVQGALAPCHTLPLAVLLLAPRSSLRRGGTRDTAVHVLMGPQGAIGCMQGTIKGHEHAYVLDSEHTFEKGRHVPVSGNTAAMLGEGGLSHLGPHFQVRRWEFAFCWSLLELLWAPDSIPLNTSTARCVFVSPKRRNMCMCAACVLCSTCVYLQCRADVGLCRAGHWRPLNPLWCIWCQASGS